MSNFTASGSERVVVVSREGTQQTMTVKPAEVALATKIIGLALQMETLDTIPSHITNSPFVVRFFENDKLALERNDDSGSVSFGWDEGDDLILALQTGLKIAINAKVNKTASLKPIHR